MIIKQTFKYALCAIVTLNTCVPAAAWTVHRHYYTPVTYVPVSTVTYVEPAPVGCILGAAAVGTVLGLGIGQAIDSHQRKKEERKREEEERAFQRRREANRRYEAEMRYEEQLQAEEKLMLKTREAALNSQLQEEAHQQRMEEIKLQAQVQQQSGLLSRFFSWIGSWFTRLW